jgi:hypothetical protein
MLSQGLVNQEEFDRLRSEVLYDGSAPKAPAIGSTGRPFSLPPKVTASGYEFRNPVTGAVARVRRTDAFLLTLALGGIYFAYKEVWLHFAIAMGLALLTYGMSWFIYPFFAYNIIVWSYRRKGWTETPLEYAGTYLDLITERARDNTRPK